MARDKEENPALPICGGGHPLIFLHPQIAIPLYPLILFRFASPQIAEPLITDPLTLPLKKVLLTNTSV
jgi:hypothetical protein